MPSVYLLSEDDFDDQILVYVLETLRPGRVDTIGTRLRKGGGIGAVRKALPLMMSAIRRSGVVDDTYFLIAIDNDRAVEHSDAHAKKPHSREEACRHCALEEAIQRGLPDGQPVPGAIAVPVQMIESWLLLLANPALLESDLPACAWRHQASARRVYGPNPPLQLKDLLAEAVRASGMTRDELVLDLVLRLDPDDLSERSPSFARFRQAILAWPSAEVATR